MIICGTCHFVSRTQAVRYYVPYFYESTAETVERKIAENEIKLGPPELKPGQHLRVIDDGARYAIEEP